MKYFICSFFFLILLSCQNGSKEERTNIETSYSIRPNDSLTISIDKAVPKNEKKEISGLFTIGSYQDFSDCKFFFECDCCSGDLILQGSLFYLFNYCVGDVRLTGGKIEYDTEQITLFSNGIIVDESFNHMYDIDSTLPKFLTESTFDEPYEIMFRIDSCQQKGLLVQQEGKNTSYAQETVQDSKAKINNLLTSSVLKSFKKSNDIKFSLGHIKPSNKIKECGCLYAESWEKFKNQEFFYANDYGTIEYLSINGEQKSIDFSKKFQGFRVTEIPYKEENIGEVLRKSGVIRIESNDNFYIEKDFVGECKCN
ncbi:MAG: hypothetical protein ABJH98_15860 [Reichenbachiella sp.]|uniref:hypothetical protein n=1 Tax=Reichenbachiella sp. TaxID=2184521 RepID=UPI003299F5FA